MELVLSSKIPNEKEEDMFQSETTDWPYDDHINGILKQTCIETQCYEEDDTELHNFDDFDNDFDWYTTTESQMLDELSILCRNLHSKLSNFSQFDDFESANVSKNENLNLFQSRAKTSSSENIPSFAEKSTSTDDSLFTSAEFERNSKLRRSLPIENKYFFGESRTNSEISNNNDNKNNNTSERKLSLLSNKKYNKHLIESPSDTNSRLDDRENCDEFLSTSKDKEENSSKLNNKSIVNLSTNSNETDRNRSDKDENRTGKKVGFSKTEIHFAPDSGKVNIVETDEKPPPTNRFRRRRRDHMKNSTHLQNKNLPSIHFGDTSYEKYIFGGIKNLNSRQNVKLDDIISNQNVTENLRKDEVRSEKAVINDYDTKRDKKEEMKHRGHVTTVNLTTNDMHELMKIVQDDSDASEVKMNVSRRKNSNEKIGLNKDQSNPLVTRTTKMTVHIPFTIPEIPHLKNIPFSSLKSVRLILNLKSAIDNTKMQDLLSSFYEPKSLDSYNKEHKLEDDNQFKIKNDETSVTDSAKQLDVNKENYESQMDYDEDKKCSTFERKSIANHYDTILKDPENIVISTKVVKTHKPVISHVEKDYTVKKITKTSKLMDHNKSVPKEKSKKQISKHGSNEGEDVMYVNYNNYPADQIYENVFTVKHPQVKKKDKQLLTKSTIKNDLNKSNLRKEKHSTSSLKANVNNSNKDTKLNGSKIKSSKRTLEITDNKSLPSTNRSKKPIEFIHKTAVFNMQNEALSKPAKSKESKSSKYVNDFICGKKSKSATKNKKTISSAIKSKATL